jgi:hypothetical protein
MLVRSWTLVLCVLACACRKPERTVPDRPPSPAADASSVAAQDAGTDDDRIRATMSIALFTKDVLEACADFRLVAPPSTPQERIDGFFDERAKNIKPGRGQELVRLKTACASQFADRIAFASCVTTAQEEGDAGMALLEIETLYYRASAVEGSDAEMRECLKAGGKWSAARADDRAARRESLRQRANELQKRIDEAE